MSDDPYLDGMQFVWDIVNKYDKNVNARNVREGTDALFAHGVRNLTVMVPRNRHNDEVFKAGVFDAAQDYREEFQKRRLEHYKQVGYPVWTALNGY